MFHGNEEGSLLKKQNKKLNKLVVMSLVLNILPLPERVGVFRMIVINIFHNQKTVIQNRHPNIPKKKKKISF